MQYVQSFQVSTLRLKIPLLKTESEQNEMNPWKGKVAVVTGASAGIGVAIVEHLVDSGLNVAGFARRKEKLDELEKKLEGRKGKFYGVMADISKESDLLDAFQCVTQEFGAVHILVNNAGVGCPNGLLDGDSKDWEAVLSTNLLGLCMATKEAVKIMQANNIDGHIIHISSITGHYVPNYPTNIYPATKHGVRALTESLRQELNSIKSKIKVTSISPGYVRSEFFESSRWVSLDEKTTPILEAADVAQAVLYVLGTPPHVQIHDIIIKPAGEYF